MTVKLIGTNKIPCYHIALKHREKKITGSKLQKTARKKEKENAGAGEKLLRSCLPGISKEHTAAILTRTHYLSGVNVYFIVERSKK